MTKRRLTITLTFAALAPLLMLGGQYAGGIAFEVFAAWGVLTAKE